MNNEILSKVLTTLENLEQGQGRINNRLDMMDGRLDRIESDIKYIKEFVTANRKLITDGIKHESDHNDKITYLEEM